MNILATRQAMGDETSLSKDIAKMKIWDMKWVTNVRQLLEKMGKIRECISVIYDSGLRQVGTVSSIVLLTPTETQIPLEFC
jgi:hypothetical protein